MPKIKILRPSVANKIAAGEVIQGPYNVVKELVENAIDAKATKIQIEVLNGGIEKVTVQDNGVGMSKEDVKLCYKKHATSKITKIKDLKNISSLGFRGEALHAISAISTVSIMSKNKESLEGFKVKISNTRLIEQTPIAMVPGTKVIVEDLFKMFPVKRKFIASKNLELKRIINLVTAYSLAYPKVKFVLKNNNKVILNIKEKSAKARLKYLLKKEDLAFFIPLKYKEEELSINGFLGHPQIASISKDNQIVLINKRVIKDKKIVKRIKKSYSNLIEPKKHPQFVILIQINPQDTDINIHPAKEEIKIMSENKLLEKIEEAVKTTLLKYDLTYQYKIKPDYQKEFEKAYEEVNYSIKEEESFWQVKEVKDEEILQVNKTYLIAKVNKDLLIFDQHAAHEKILYNQIIENIKKGAQIQLKKPLIINTSLTNALKIEEKIEIIKKIGISIEPFGKNTFKVSKIPKFIPKDKVIEIIEEIVEGYETGIKIKNIAQSNLINKIASYIACKNAIKAGEYLTLEERKNLINKALETPATYTCPHGRPAYIRISSKELDKMFKRT